MENAVSEYRNRMKNFSFYLLVRHEECILSVITVKI